MKKTKTITHTDSKSLWNYTLSPGWNVDEVKILKFALQKFGVGKWKLIQGSECLPGKSIGQIYIQTQRLLGQQSLGEFMGLHLDLERIWRDNSKKIDATRKNGCIINTGDNPTKEERQRRIEENKQKYSIDDEEVKKIKLPRVREDCVAKYFTLEEIDQDKFTNLEKLIHMSNLIYEIDKKIIDLEDPVKKLKIDVQKE